MGETPEQRPHAGKVGPQGIAGGGAPVLLAVEPDALLRWSLVTYFGPRFDVRAVDTPEAGLAVLNSDMAAAVVVSDAVASLDVVNLERLAIARNPDVCIIRVVTSLRSAPDDAYATATLEKPFELSALAKLLPGTKSKHPR